MKFLKGAFVGVLLLDLLVVHSKVIQLSSAVDLQESLLNGRLKKATANQDKSIKQQEVLLLRHTVGIQDRVAFLEAQFNECKLQTIYISGRLDKLAPLPPLPDPRELPNIKEPVDIKKKAKR